jgi:hypothetical protein
MGCGIGEQFQWRHTEILISSDGETREYSTYFDTLEECSELDRQAKNLGRTSECDLTLHQKFKSL